MSVFIESLLSMHDGEVVRELDEKLLGMIQTVKILGKGGAVRLELAIDPSKNDIEAIHITPKIDQKEPKPAVSPAFFFLDEEGKPTRISPIERQRRL